MIRDSYFEECLEKFHELPEPIQELIGGEAACLKIKKLEDAYDTSLSFATILVAVGELTIDDLAEYLNLKFGLDKTKGEEIAGRLEDEIFEPVLDFIVDNTELDDKIEVGEDTQDKKSLGLITGLSAADKKDLIIKTFSGEIVPALYAKPDKLQDFNIAIFQAFNAEEGLEDKVETLFYNNQEKLSEHHIILDGHPASPSIANWLKDFIKKYGSGLFNEVVLAEYLSQSPNIKLIKPEERELVRKVLKLYHNLVFFPESMANVPLEKWEIFPVDRTKLNSINDVLSDDVPPVKPVVTEEKAISEPTPVIRKAPEISERQKIIFDLQKNLTKYPASSLEYKAIYQEINRLSRK
ncbi:MAG: hypothetical protein WCK59_01015 [Candidatus Falkowbacteria bacterium]